MSDAVPNTAGTPFTTDALHVRERDGGVRGLYGRGLTWVSLNPMSDLPCSIDFAMRNLPGLGLISGTVQGIRHDRTRAHIGDGNDDFSIHLNLSGRSIVAGRGREITLLDGDAMLLSYAESRAITRPELVRYRIIRVPRALLVGLVRNLDDAVARPIPRGTGVLSLLTNYVGALIDDPALVAPEVRRLIVAQLCDLIAVTIGATREAAAIAEDRGIRAARLRAIKNDIEDNLTHEDLSPGAVAGRQRISDSYIRKLFESEGTSFSAFVLGRRLARAHAMLTDSRRSDRSIASIAFEAGFGDLSYFNRSFRRSYGATPSDVREAHRHGGGISRLLP
jgi:AraC-like DNA-binding protein